jgi:hypothetical protein
MTPQQIAAAIECANYVFDSDCEETSFQEWLEEGHEPYHHIYYQAAVVLGIEDSLQDTIKTYSEN